MIVNESNLNDTDLETIELFVDGELAPGDAAALQHRITAEPQLAAMLDHVRRQRATRRQLFHALEVESDGVDLSGAIGRALNQEAVREIVSSNRRRSIRYGSIAAACLAVGVTLGWFGHDRNREIVAPQQPVQSVAEYAPSNSQVDLTSNDTSPDGFNVAITDDLGHVIGQQHFRTLDEARNFSSDVNRWQTRQRDVRSGNVRLVGDDF